jgi:glycosyltransferase involved in cell wall biosynthesis
MTSEPLVSVLVPTYNGARHLDEALRALSEQTYPHLEVIIRDDGSTDETERIARGYCEADSRFSFRADGRRLGTTGNMAELLRLASGAFVKVCHQDDVLGRDCVERLLAPMVADPTIVLATSARHHVTADGTVLPERPCTRPLLAQDAAISGLDLSRHMILSGLNQVGEPSIVMFRNGIINPTELGVLDGVTYEFNNDIALWLRLLAVGSAYWIVEPLSSFRVHNEQRSSRLDEAITGTLEWIEFLKFARRHDLVRTPAEFAQVGKYVLQSIVWVSEWTESLPVAERGLHAARIADGLAALRRVVGSEAA